MAKMTLLEICQDISNDADTDPFNSINDTIESQQIAQIVKTSFFELVANRNWPHLKRTTQLNNVSDLTKPTHLRLPEGTKELVSFTYNKLKEDELDRDRYKELRYLEPEEFLRRTNERNLTKNEVVRIFDFGGSPILIENDKQPDYFTSFDDEYVIMDSYNLAIEDTLQGSRTQVLLVFDPTWEHIDSHIPDLPSEAFPLLVEEAKSMAMIVLRQTANPKSEQRARRQGSWLARKSWQVKGGVGYPNYGRRQRYQKKIRTEKAQ